MPSPELHFNNVVDVKPWMSRISLDVAGNFILSHDFQTIHGNQEFYNAWHSNEKRGTFSQFTWQGLSLEWIKRLFPTPQDKQITSAGIYIRNAVSRIVDERLRQYKRLDKIPEDVLGQMITMGESTREEYIEQAVFAIGVAFDTIANLLSCALYHIAKRPVLQPTLRAEIRHAGERSSVSGDIYRRMPALTAIILEASRLHPPIPVTIRKVVRNTRIKGTFNAAHWGVAATLSSSGHMMLWEATLTERYYKTADTLVDKLAQVYRDQATDLQKSVVKFIDEYYVPDEGEPKPSPEATKLVAKSIAKDILAYIFEDMKKNNRIFYLQRTPKHFTVERQVKEAVTAWGVWIPHSTLKAMEQAKFVDDMIFDEIQTDIARIDKHIAFLEPLLEITSMKMIKAIYNPDSVHLDTFAKELYKSFNKQQAHDTIDALKEELWISSAAPKLKEALDNDAKAAELAAIFQDGEWSNDIDTLRMERSVLLDITDRKVVIYVVRALVGEITAKHQRRITKILSRIMTAYETRDEVSEDLLKDL